MARIRSFPPIENASAHTLILGTMPGTASLAAHEYYAHPRNLFWTIFAELLGFDVTTAYADRLRHLVSAGIAVWDVLQSCERPGSLDSSIEPASVVPNDFPRFFAEHPHVRRVCFNGAHAEALYRRHVAGAFEHPSPLTFVRLPSTSPANASIRYEAKVLAWRAALSHSCATQRAPSVVP